MVQQAVEFLLELLPRRYASVRLFEFQYGRHERLGDVAPAELSKMPVGVRTGFCLYH
jgi:hypothetical protein